MIKLPKECPPEFYKVIYDQCGGFVDCEANPQTIWKAAVSEVQRLNATAQPVSDGWVKCSERLPENSNDVTVLSEQYGVVNGYYWDGDVEPRWFVCCGEHEGSVYDITHWMPMPAAPGGQDD